MITIKDERLVKAITAIYEHGFHRRTDSAPMEAAVGEIATIIHYMQQDQKRMDLLQLLVNDRYQVKSGISLSIRWPDGVTLVNPDHIRGTLDEVMKQLQK
jgi:hypothetical protein